MRVLIVFLSLSFPCMAEPLIDGFTQQEIPPSGKGVPKVVFSGSQVKNIQYAEVDGKPLLLDLYLPEKPVEGQQKAFLLAAGQRGEEAQQNGRSA